MNIKQSTYGLARCIEGHIYILRENGRLCPYCLSVLEYDAGSPMPVNEKLIPPQPVIGWLVGIAGVSRGRDYRIVTEKNFIGRTKDMHIRILGDKKIDEHKHGTIAFDPRNQKITLIPSTGLMLLNEGMIYEPTTVTGADIITIGSSTFKLVLLSEVGISWQEIKDGWQFKIDYDYQMSMIKAVGEDFVETTTKTNSDIALNDGDVTMVVNDKNDGIIIEENESGNGVVGTE